MCVKIRLWKAVVAPEDVRVLRGEDILTEYRFGNRTVQHLFCRTCGVVPFGRGEMNGKPFVAVNVTSLDDATDTELAEVPIVYQNGRKDAWEREPTETRYL